MDNSQNLPGSDQAWVHVQVHNRSNTPANAVSVWAIYSNAGAGLQGLNVSPSLGNDFNFWSQFTVTGQIIPNLPADSPWKSVGSPIQLTGISAASPQVASFRWTVPTLGSGDPGHYCIAAFIHSAASPINGTSMDVDDLAPTNRQVGQKNLHIGRALAGWRGAGGRRGRARRWRAAGRGHPRAARAVGARRVQQPDRHGARSRPDH